MLLVGGVLDIGSFRSDDGRERGLLLSFRE
jgi:hypothetical protein